MTSDKKFVSYKELDIWKRSYKFSLDVIKLTAKLPRTVYFDIIIKQIIRSATSISANIAEGSGAYQGKEFILYINIARKSAIETDYWLNLIRDLHTKEELEIKRLIKECDEIIRILSAIILKIKYNKK